MRKLWSKIPTYKRKHFIVATMIAPVIILIINMLYDMTATEIITLYRPSEKIVIAEVQIGENYYIPNDVSIYAGTIEEFMRENKDYTYENDY